MTVFDGFTKDRPLVLVGCGRMGSAMLSGWLDRGLPDAAVWVVEPDLGPVEGRFPALDPGNLVQNVSMLPGSLRPAAVILAVKPQMLDDVAAALAEKFDQPGLLVSIAAGKDIAFFEQHFGISSAVVRAMPNTPAAIGKGMTVAVANGAVGGRDREVAGALLSAVGAFAWIDDERLMDAVTAVSGSGPAYVFYLAECLAAAGEAAGLPAALARTLAVNTVCGAGALMDEGGEDPSRLRANVTSPGGTTAAALDVLMKDKDGLPSLMRRTVAAATKRSRELSG